MKQLVTLPEMRGAAVGCPPRPEVPPYYIPLPLCHPVYTCAVLIEKGPQLTGYRVSAAPSKPLEQLQAPLT